MTKKDDRVGGRVIRRRRLDHADGERRQSVYLGEVPVTMPKLREVLRHADEMGGRYPANCACAPMPIRRRMRGRRRELGAEGIGLCRTEHMFFKDFEHPEQSSDRQFAIQEMILANDRIPE